MEALRRRKAQIERALHSSGVLEEFRLFFQSIDDRKTGEISANEAPGWTHTELASVGSANGAALVTARLDSADGRRLLSA